MRRSKQQIRDGLAERMAAPGAQREQMLHNAALKRHYAVGTRVRSLKSNRDGVIVWYGRDKQRRVLGQGLIRLGVKFDGQAKAAFIGSGNIVRKDGLTLDDTKARRTTPARRFRVRHTTGLTSDGGMLHGRRTVGDSDLSDEEFARLGDLAREHNAGALIFEVVPGTVREFDARSREKAWADARRMVEHARDGRGTAIVFIGLDGKAAKVA